MMTPEQHIQKAGGAIVPFMSPATVSAPSRFPLIWFDDVKPRLDRRYIVKGLLASGALSVTYGESGSGKTYIVLTIALHVALGWPWQGHQTAQCGVVYIAAEGGDGALNRVAAFKAHHPDFPAGVKSPFAVITAPINLLDPDADVADLAECIHGAEKAIGRPIGLIVIDTLSRALAGGEENSSQDMGLFVRNVDRIRSETGAHVLIVHHSGKDQARGARGHSLLRAATDTEIEVTSDEATGIRRMVVKKQRDLPTDGEFAFRLVSVDLGIDQDGDMVSSCIVEPCDDERATPRSRPKLSGGAKVGLEKLFDCIADQRIHLPASNHIPGGVSGVTLTMWREYLGNAGIINMDGSYREQFRRIRVTLQDAGLIGVWDEFVWTVT